MLKKKNGKKKTREDSPYQRFMTLVLIWCFYFLFFYLTHISLFHLTFTVSTAFHYFTIFITLLHINRFDWTKELAFVHLLVLINDQFPKPASCRSSSRRDDLPLPSHFLYLYASSFHPVPTLVPIHPAKSHTSHLASLPPSTPNTTP